MRQMKHSAISHLRPFVFKYFAGGNTEKSKLNFVMFMTPIRTIGNRRNLKRSIVYSKCFVQYKYNKTISNILKF